MKNIRTIAVFATALSLSGPVFAADSQNVTGIKTGASLFTGAMEYLGIRHDQAVNAGQIPQRNEPTLVEKYHMNRAINQNVDFGK
jgi:hypothetical protein